MNQKDMEVVQRGIGYTFTNSALLKQAFTRKSYAEEHEGECDNEVLEFYGDKTLDGVVMRHLRHHFGSINAKGQYVSQKTAGELTDFKENLVCRKMLAHRMGKLGFAPFLVMGQGDINEQVQKQDSVKEDLFEAIIGAVAMDCDGDMMILDGVVTRMLNLPYYLEHGFDDENYVALVQARCQAQGGSLPDYDYSECKQGFSCTLTLSSEGKSYYAVGKSKPSARMAAAQQAYDDLKDLDKRKSLIDEVGEPNEGRAVNQLQELHQKGHIPASDYRWAELDNNGNPIWHCMCSVSGWDDCEGEDSSKKTAKKKAAYQMLCQIICGQKDQ